MQLNKECMKTIIKFVADHLNNGQNGDNLNSDLFGSVCNQIEKSSDFSKDEISVHMMRCIREGFIYASDSKIQDTIRIKDVSLNGFDWLEKESK